MRVLTASLATHPLCRARPARSPERSACRSMSEWASVGSVAGCGLQVLQAERRRMAIGTGGRDMSWVGGRQAGISHPHTQHIPALGQLSAQPDAPACSQMFVSSQYGGWQRGWRHIVACKSNGPPLSGRRAKPCRRRHIRSCCLSTMCCLHGSVEVLLTSALSQLIARQSKEQAGEAVPKRTAATRPASGGAAARYVRCGSNQFGRPPIVLKT